MSLLQIGAIDASGLSSVAFDRGAAAFPAMRSIRAAPPAQAAAPDFVQILGAGLERLDQGLHAADARMRGVAIGDEVPLHETMIAMEQARMRLMLAVEVRNRLIEAYQELTRMQL